MKLGKIRDNQLMPFYCIPFIGGAAIACSIFLLKIIRSFYRGFLEDANNTYEVTTTVYDPVVPRVSKSNESDGLATFIILIVAIVSIIASGFIFIELCEYLLTSPYILLLPFCAMGVASYFYRDEITKMVIEKNYRSTNTFHFIIAAIVSVYIAYNILVNKWVPNIAPLKGDYLFLLIPFSMMVFGGFLGPLSISLTLITGGYKAAYRQSGIRGLIVNKLNLAFVLFMPATMLYYYLMTDDNPITLMVEVAMQAEGIMHTVIIVTNQIVLALWNKML
ncbi:hypothetical protein [Alishewanella longhuensis]|uniref:hypothetical protein n=1 Tax=Alishewanella longhuensis TaxID=1091037 RepID=UPI0016753A78|nr:hypothetical protein [Alishewanella longhuensis]